MNNVVLSSYFTSKPDIQRGCRQKKDDFDYIAHWHTSIERLGMEGIIFHDGLSDGFLDKYQSEKIKFKEVTLGDLSTNDERFFIYDKFLKNKDYDNVLMTDISDVWFKNNPFEIIKGSDKLFVGSEQVEESQRGWLRRRFELIYGKMPKALEKGDIYNAGIIGGSVEVIGVFLDNMVEEMESLIDKKGLKYFENNKISLNMTVFNKIICDEYKFDEVVTGSRLHSPFRRYLKDGDYYIFHK